jgi:predicted ferric reductase
MTPPRRGWSRDVLGALGIFSVLVVVALWVRNRGIQDLLGAATGATSLGRLTGLLAADLLLVQVFLMARVPWLERAYGQDKLARRHRLVGFTSFHLMLAHIVLITIGYAAADRHNPVRELWDLVTTYPGMLLALAATAALVMVVVTSVRAARRRLRYESWHLLHLYAYLGVGLAIPHQLWTGTDFTGSGWAQLYWWTAYGVAAGSVLVFRLGVPVWRSLVHRIEVHAVVPEAPGVVSVWLRGHRLDRLPVRAGQFFTWRFLTGPGWSRGHPYSLSAAPRPDLLRITVKDLGDGSGLVPRLRPGTRVLVEGPYGALTEVRRTRSRVTMLASGIGITPLRALLEALPYQPGHATLVYRARDAEDFAFRAELDRLSAYRGIRLVYLPGPRAADDSWAPARYGRDDQLLHRIVPDLAKHDVFICGPEPWMAAAARAARALGVPEDQLHMESFAW